MRRTAGLECVFLAAEIGLFDLAALVEVFQGRLGGIELRPVGRRRTGPPVLALRPLWRRRS